MRLPGKIVRRRPAELLMAVEALALLVFFRVCLVVVPVHRIILTITRGAEPNGDACAGTGGDADESEAGTKNDAERAAEEIARRVRWAVEAIARHSPIALVCFPQTLAGYTMLRRRGVRSTMVYGVAHSAAGKLMAHTWLVVGDRVVLGGEDSAQFTPVERWG